jgi:redox-sensitive bicupin YhaK (pirin superfamily)
MRIGNEGSFRPGDIRWVKAGHAYGPEEAGEEGVQFHLFSLGGDIGLNWADLYDVPEALTARLSQFQQPAGRRRVDDMPVVSPADALPGWDQMPDEGPLIFRVSMDAGEDQAAFCPGFDSVWFVLEGTVKVNGTITVASGEFFCAGADVSCSLKASNEGAHWLVFSSRSQQPL